MFCVFSDEKFVSKSQSLRSLELSTVRHSAPATPIASPNRLTHPRTDLLPELSQQVDPLLLEQPVHGLHGLQVHIRWWRYGGRRRRLHADPFLHVGQRRRRHKRRREHRLESPPEETSHHIKSPTHSKRKKKQKHGTQFFLARAVRTRGSGAPVYVFPWRQAPQY